MTHTERCTLAACIAHVAGAAASDVPLDREEQRAWLAERGLGLVPVAGAATFSWPGPWIARRPARDGSGPRAAVMFGVPSGAIWDPADTADEILDGYVVAPLDVAAWPPRPAAEAGVGRVEALVGHEFMLGEARCRGRRLCEPCAHLDRLNGGGVLRPLVHRGGLRADIICDGTVRVGDRLTPI